MARQPSKKKGPFDSLDTEWKDRIASSDPLDIDTELANLAKLEVETQRAKEADMDLKSAKEDYDSIASPYQEDFKAFKLKKKFCVQVLGDKGKM